MKKLMLIILGIIILIGTNTNEASAGSLPESSKVHLKVGPYFVLYTKPVAPLVDQNHRLLVPLRSIEDLFGGKVKYDSSIKTASLSWLGHDFQFSIGSKDAKVDNQTISMDTTPVLKQGAMMLPLRIFLDQTDMEYHWDKELQVLVIDDDRVIVGEPFKDFAGNDLYSQNVDGAFRIDNYTLSSGKNQTFKLAITATNITDDDIPEGRSDIHPLVSFGASYGGFSTDSYSRPFYPALPSVGKGEEVVVTQSYPLVDVDYIITVARLFSE